MEKTEQSKGKKITKRLVVKIAVFMILAAVLMAATYAIDAARNDRNLILKKISRNLKEDKEVSVSYTYRPGRSRYMGRHRIPLYAFTPEESARYTFTVSNIASERESFLTLQVADSYFNNYLSIDNEEEQGDSFSGTVFLNGGSVCYVIVDAVSGDNEEEFSGSFRLKVSEAEEDASPLVVTEDEPATVKVREDSQTAALFIPAESGFFRFDTKVRSKDKSASTAIAAVKSPDDNEIRRSEGICYLEGGREYYVWVSANDLSKSSVKAEVSCRRINTLGADAAGEYDIHEDTIIEYKSSENQNLAVYSVSDGNPACFVYDDRGFPLNHDDDSGAELGDNKKDFALVLQAQSRTGYLIYIGGEFNDCRVVISKYTGDGSTLGRDDIEALRSEDQESETPEFETQGSEEQINE